MIDSSLEKELKKLNDELQKIPSAQETGTSVNRLDYKTILKVHKLLKTNNLWNLLPKQEQSKEKN